MRDLGGGGLVGWLEGGQGRGFVGVGGGWVGREGSRRKRKLGQWCYSALASSLASSGASSTCRKKEGGTHNHF